MHASYLTYDKLSKATYGKLRHIEGEYEPKLLLLRIAKDVQNLNTPKLLIRVMMQL